MTFGFGFGFSRSASFSPINIAGLQLWLDASDTSTITDTGGAVTQWDDKSGNTNHATAAGGSEPTTGTRTLNTLNALDFDGTEFMTLPSGLYSIPSNSNTTFVVVAVDVSSNHRLLEGEDSGTDGYTVRIKNTDELAVKNGGTDVTQSFTFDTNQHMCGSRRNGSLLEAIYDGNVTSGSAGVSDQTLTSLEIGQNTNASNQRLNGALGEILIYNAALTDAQVNQVGNYLADKWNFTWTNI